jgi:hypothetical protein
MYNLIAVFLLAAASQPNVSITLASPVNPVLVQRRDAIAATLSPSAKLKLHDIASTLGRSAAITDGTSRSAIVSAFPGVNLSDGDISALTFLVLMEASESAQQDLQSIMKGVSAINAQKEALRKELGKAAANKVRVQTVYTPVNTAFTVPLPLSPNATMAEKEKRLDDLSELSEDQQLRMQMVMDRMQKAESMASNVAKKFGDIQSSVIRNLK